MFGYIKTDTPNMYMKDTVLYGSLYCGLCKSLSRTCGGKGRISLSYDLTFLSLIAHNLLNVDVKIEKKHCFLHPIKKRNMSNPDLISDRIACLNVLLAYYKITDDIIDNNKGKIKKSFFKSSYKKAKKKEPVLDRIVQNRFNDLLKLEKINCKSIDIVSDPFGLMIVDVMKEILGKSFDLNSYKLFYNLGKWIYLIDALDDIDKDIKNKNYNVFVSSYNISENKKGFIDANKKELEIIFGTVLSEVSESEKQLRYHFNHDLIDNILLLGLKTQTKKIMENDKCKTIYKNISKF